ncbi:MULTISPECIES: carbohydrate porin [unclassified Bradyrhizobium]|uniref:carbohydrate porin n=1 Tax=unclassified Bradyrhizobium TaxID=2631580 RepID=UPI001BA64AB8|nr:MULTISPECIES: carbohydrate porin [unclassified Bradyrhizobium]MBR1208155.1 carbohydrate porin [Bradyrhizobium sp. AUGA SZCCT0124]MBR1316436.1 carbohydrate porin [Bradyrhizobium sp. AUGA SZCCT0051]MBR1344669.1 carbohydrate porin [Bradyrhizobium sp. AUGA SZCCT0105]MBR1359457.1 carbohydrate porin [Bradyrhizobium sp. AUGA SZCCT0045]
MKRVIFGVFLATGCICDGIAADGERPRLAETFDWTGPFAGAHLAYSAGSSQFSSSGQGSAPAAGSFGLINVFDPSKGTGSYAIGLSAGYNYMFPSRVVLGVEADVSFPNTIAGSAVVPGSQGPSTFREAVQASGSVRARLGYAPGAWLFYATGGLAWTYDRSTLAPGVGADGEAQDLTRLGFAWGAGAELGLSPNWSARFEYLGTGFGSQGVTFSGAAQRVSSDWAVHTARLGFNYRFGRDEGQVLDAGLKPLETDWFNLRAQTTYLQQYAAPFRAPYRGTNSLIPNQSRETWDVTFYAGMRPWEGGEFWINPEIDQGFGLSSTLGVAGFPSGEAYKVGSAVPYARIPRAFFRQTFNLGGETKKVDGDINQFASTQTSDRIVLTVGKFAVTDVFDNNKYAHDPRKDLMNWSLIDTGTFDYAADAWGYTYGAAIEWYTGAWTIRGGLFDLSRVPNSQELDPTFQQFQWVGEIEHRHEIWGKPGKVAVTGFLSRGRMGRFDDAVALTQATGGPADTASVRSYRSRAGVSVNLEQEVTRDLGIFARAGVADGSVESYEFTDIDRTAAAGLSLAGASWNRPNDTFGLAGVINGISSARRAYLDAGGLGILVGDGRLPNPGPEKIIETYYSFPVSAWRATLNYQLVTNPAYNRDRGPASIFGARLRAQF